MQRILNIVGWIGVAIVVAAVALKFWGPVEWQRTAVMMSWAGLVLVLLYPRLRVVVNQLRKPQTTETSKVHGRPPSVRRWVSLGQGV